LNCLPSVNFIPKLPRTFERHDFSGRQHHALAGGGIPAPALTFSPDAELPETGYQNIFTRFERSLDDLKQRRNCIRCLILDKAIGLGNVLDYSSFREFRYAPPKCGFVGVNFTTFTLVKKTMF